MSGSTGGETAGETTVATGDGGSPARWRGLGHPAMIGVALLTYAYVSVLYDVTDVVGGSETLLLVVAASAGAAVLLGRALPSKATLFLGTGIVAAGMAYYFLSVPESNRALFTAGRVVSDTLALVTGLSVLRLTNAGVWALSIAPAPVFLSLSFALRGRYGPAVAVGGVALLFFVLTGDAGNLTTLVGVVGVVAALGFETLNVRGGVRAQLDTLVVVVAAMIVLSAVVSVVPGGTARPLLSESGEQPGTVEENVVSSGDRVDVLGSIRLSPEVRFTVESNDSAYWQTGAYDRYTGEGWVRTDTAEPYSGPLSDPPGSSSELKQTVTAETEMEALPAAWKPVAVEGTAASSARVTSEGGLLAGQSLQAGESYTVRSEVPRYTAEQLRRSGTDYPDGVEGDYTQLPDSTSDRVRERSANVAGDEDNAYDKAVAIEEHLESEKEYSLNVEEPDGEIADEFLFEMDAGYCTYYATTMVVMLRSEGVPARFVTGYTPGERAGDERVVRGTNAHAWVEVYFPDAGWVRFDPTPADPRRSAADARVEEARQSGDPGVDTEETRERRDDRREGETPDPSDTETPEPTEPPEDTDTPDPNGDDPDGNGANDTNGSDDPDIRTPAISPNGSDGGGGGGSGDGDGLPTLPSRETLGLGAVLLVGLVAGMRRTNAVRRASRLAWLAYQRGSDDPARDAERAYARLEHLLEGRYRPRRPGETSRAYLRSLSSAGLDARAERVGRIYERARYGDGITRAEAERAIGDVNAMVRERASPLGRLRR
ncbi:transglutaminase TgpA family protein [Halegenticoccus tardaugens]|uniref:transglutaminase TgpA family protein n=1 Tax=Halegenticoccus tardaugens TaxID=2071624 RepID=UPI001E30AA14|nr:transglutaminaseTgpA domain-containing protein [Halegenticoccus tardaugens]